MLRQARLADASSSLPIPEDRTVVCRFLQLLEQLGLPRPWNELIVAWKLPRQLAKLLDTRVVSNEFLRVSQRDALQIAVRLRDSFADGGKLAAVTLAHNPLPAFDGRLDSGFVLHTVRARFFARPAPPVEVCAGQPILQTAKLDGRRKLDVALVVRRAGFAALLLVHHVPLLRMRRDRRVGVVEREENCADGHGYEVTGYEVDW